MMSFYKRLIAIILIAIGVVLMVFPIYACIVYNVSPHNFWTDKDKYIGLLSFSLGILLIIGNFIQGNPRKDLPLICIPPVILTTFVFLYNVLFRFIQHSHWSFFTVAKLFITYRGGAGMVRYILFLLGCILMLALCSIIKSRFPVRKK